MNNIRRIFMRGIVSAIVGGAAVAAIPEKQNSALHDKVMLWLAVTNCPDELRTPLAAYLVGLVK